MTKNGSCDKIKIKKKGLASNKSNVAVLRTVAKLIVIRYNVFLG